MTQRESFLAALRAQVGSALYVWGGNGDLVTAMSDPVSWITAHEVSDSSHTKAQNGARVVALYRKLQAAGVVSIRAFDCSGLVYWALRQAGVSISDTSSRGFFARCDIIPESDLQAGDLVFRGVDTDGDGLEQSEVRHVGVYVGGGYTIECYGRDVGVVSRKLAAGKWLKCGRLRCLSIDTAASAPEAAETVTEDGRYIFRAILSKRRKSLGQDVVELKKLLIQKGYGTGITVDTSSSGTFGPATDACVKAFQRASGLTVDGAAGPDTIRALGGEWGD